MVTTRSGRWGRIQGMGCARAFAPFFGGGRPVEGLPMGLCLRSKWKGLRGEYCGKPSMHASTGSIRKMLDSSIGAESRLPRRPSAVLPPSRPLPLVFCQASAFHSWPRHPPLGGGRACRPSCSLHSWNSKGVHRHFSVASQTFSARGSRGSATLPGVLSMGRVALPRDRGGKGGGTSELPGENLAASCRELPPVGPDLRAGRAKGWPMSGRPEVGPYRPAPPCERQGFRLTPPRN